MNRKETLNTFGRCYNNGDFNTNALLLHDECAYEAYDCIYKVISQKEVIKVLTESVKDATSAFEGFYLHKGVLFKRLTECVLICDDVALKCSRIIYIKQKRGKIVNIIGFNPQEHEFTRGKKISD